MARVGYRQFSGLRKKSKVHYLFLNFYFSFVFFFKKKETKKKANKDAIPKRKPGMP
jgi:hypothetical protein